jgi:hypothetical protein
MKFAWLALALALLAPVAAQAQGYRISRAPDPAADDPLREEKLKDRATIAELNRAEAKRTAERDRRNIQQRNAANARAQAQYEAAMADWRRRVAACRGGDWSQCDR